MLTKLATELNTARIKYDVKTMSAVAGILTRVSGNSIRCDGKTMSIVGLRHQV